MLKRSTVYEKSNMFQFVFLTIIILLIVQYLYNLAMFVKKYKTSFDFGQMIKNICKDEFFESESHRFEIAKNEEELKNILKDIDYSKPSKLIIIIIMIVSLLFLGILGSLSVNLFFNMNFINEILGNSSQENSLLKGLLQFILPSTVFQTIIVVMKLLFEKEILLGIFISIAFIVNLFIILLYPYNIYKEVFNEVFKMKFLPDLPINLLTIIIILLFLRLSHFIVDKEGTGMFSTYLKSISLFLSDDIFGTIVYLIVIFGYMLIFSYLQQISKKEDKTSNFEDKTFIDFMKYTWGLDQSSNSFTLHSMIFIVFIQLVWYFMIKNNESNNHNTVLTLVMIPIICLVLLFVIERSGLVNNNFIRQNIVSNPISLYKTHLFDINKEINKILHYENENYVDSDNSINICQNVGNAILSVLYSDLFKNISSSEIDITPEFKYTLVCDKESYDFKGDKLYDIMFYIKQKRKEQDIFFDPINCSKVNRNIFDIIQTNVTNYNEQVLKDKLNAAIINVLSNRLYYDDSDFFIVKNGEYKNNKLVDIAKIYDNQIQLKKYDSVIDKVIEQYKEIKSFYPTSYTNDEQYTKENIKKLTSELFKRFNNINEIMSDVYVLNEKAKITNYIISNYNNINTTEPYNHRNLWRVSSSLEKIHENFNQINDFMESSVKILKFLKDNKVGTVFNDRKDEFKKHAKEIDNMMAKLKDIGIKFNSQNMYSSVMLKNILNNNFESINKENVIKMLQSISEISKSIDDYKRTVENDIEKNMNKNVADSFNKKAIDSDRLIYFVLLNYIIVIAITNFII